MGGTCSGTKIAPRIDSAVKWLYGLVALALGCGGGDAGPDGALEFDTVDCWDGVMSPVEDYEAECGFVQAPSVHGAPDGNFVNLAVVRYRSTTRGPQITPAIFLQGGPGGRVIDDLDALVESLLEALGDGRDVIAFDPRGVGRSGPQLRCDAELESTEPEAISSAFATCRNELDQRRVDLRAYRSLENAADVDAIRQALGYEKLVLYGTSYGSLVAQHMLRDFPDAVESVILDGVLPPTGVLDWLAETSRAEETALIAASEQCEADRSCRPDAAMNLSDTVDAILDAVVPQASDEDTFEVDRGLALAFINVGLRINLATLAVLIDRLEGAVLDQDTRDRDALERLVTALEESNNSISQLHFFSVTCSEHDRITAGELVDQGVRPAFVSSAEPTLATLEAVCDGLNLPTIENSARQGVSSDIPALLLSGQIDPATPPMWGDLVARDLAQSTHVTFEALGHVTGLLGDPCPISITRAFLDDPDAALETSCARDITVASQTMERQSEL